MAFASSPCTAATERRLLQSYLQHALDPETTAWFEAWLLTQLPLIELLDRFNDARDRQAGLTPISIGSCEDHTASIGRGIGTFGHAAATRQFAYQHAGATSRLLGTNDRGQTGNDGCGGRSSIEEMARAGRRARIRFASRTNDVAPRSNAENLRTGIPVQRVAASLAGKVKCADGQHLRTCSRILDAIGQRIAVTRGCDNDKSMAPGQSRQGTRQHTRRRTARPIETQTERNHVGPLGQRPRTRQFHGEAVTAAAALDHLGDDQVRVCGNAIATAAIEGLARAGSNAGARCPMAVSTVVLNRARAHEGALGDDATIFEIGVRQIKATIKNGNARASASWPVCVQSERLRRQHARPQIRRHKATSLADLSDGFGRVDPQCPTPDLPKPTPTDELPGEDRSEHRHEQGRRDAGTQSETDLILDQTMAPTQQFRNQSRPQR